MRPSFHAIPTPASCRGPMQRAAGIGLLQVLVLLVLLGGAIVAGFTLLRAERPVRDAVDQAIALRWADEALVAYAAANAHLPCAVATPTSAASDCVAPGSKGWLPLRALEAVHPGGTRPGAPLRYTVFRGEGEADLATASNAFSPHRWDRTAHSLDPINGLDFCAKLGEAAQQTASTVRMDRARTRDAGGATVNVAYALAAPGPTPGDAGGRFDGVNQGADAAMESPSRGADERYDDRTRARDFASLARTLGCGTVDARSPGGVSLAALDLMALAVDVNDEVVEQHEGNVEDTTLAVAMASVSTAFAGIAVALGGASIANSVSTLATASAQLSSAIASCVVLVGCGLIPPYTAAVTAAGVAIGLASGATALYAGALVPTSMALATTIEARDMAQQGLPSASIDISAATERTCTGAEGGWVTQVVNGSGVLVTVDPPVWRDGLRQEAEATAAELAALQLDITQNRDRITRLEQIPSVELIDYPPPPVRQQNESDAAWNARYQAWLDTRAQQETMLQAKLEAIRAAMTAKFAAETQEQTVENLDKELAAITTSVTELRVQIAFCSGIAAGDVVGQRRCAAQREALRGLETCDADVMTADQVRERQCLPWKTQDLADARAALATARDTATWAELTAVGHPQPPIKNYITNTGWFLGPWDCNVFGWCDPLIVWNQSDNDKRETYAKTVYKSFGLEAALAEKQSEFDEKQTAYEAARAQCETLRALNPGGGASGTEIPPAWVGANAIMTAANCRGATGAVQPGTCGGTP
ncbi:hypothetical protein GCM10028794_25590 [Silanimonas algicola]